MSSIDQRHGEGGAGRPQVGRQGVINRERHHGQAQQQKYKGNGEQCRAAGCPSGANFTQREFRPGDDLKFEHRFRHKSYPDYFRLNNWPAFINRQLSQTSNENAQSKYHQ